MTMPVIRTAMLAVALSLSALLAMPADASAEAIKLTTQEWYPYQTVVNGQVQGLAVKAVKCVIEKTGNTADISVLPWVRAQKDVADGIAGGFFAASKSAARDATADMSQPFIPQVWRWYTPADKTVDVTSKAAKVAVQAGSGMEKWLEESGYASTQKLQTTDAQVKMLQSGRIDAVLANEIVFKEALAPAGIPESAFKSIPHSDRPLGVYFGKTFLAAHPGFLDKFNGAIKGCQ